MTQAHYHIIISICAATIQKILVALRVTRDRHAYLDDYIQSNLRVIY